MIHSKWAICIHFPVSSQLKEYGAPGIHGELALACVIVMQVKVGHETSLGVRCHAMALIQRPLVAKVRKDK